MDSLFLLGFVGAAIAAVFAYMQTKKVMSYSEGTERMAKLAASIREGANAYLKQQYTTVGKVFVFVFIILLAIAFGSGGESFVVKLFTFIAAHQQKKYHGGRNEYYRREYKI